MNIEDLDRDDLLFFIGCYNNYIVDFYDNHEEGMQPVCAYEFFDNEFQEIIKQDKEKLYDNIFENAPLDFKYFGGSTFIYKGLFVELREDTIKMYEEDNYYFQMDFAIFETEEDLNTDYDLNIGVGYYEMQPYEEYWNYVRNYCNSILEEKESE